MSLKTDLQGAIDYCNTALVNKGADEASTVYEIGDMIDTIETGGIDENTIYVSKYTTVCTGWFQNAYPRMRDADVVFDITLASNLTDLQNVFRTAQPKSITIKGSTANITRFDGAFKENSGYLETINGEINFTSATSVSNIFQYSSGLKNVAITSSTLSLSISFSDCSLLTEESLSSIIAGLKDMTEQTAPTLTLHATAKAKLTAEQIATITAKNWTLA